MLQIEYHSEADTFIVNGQSLPGSVIRELAESRQRDLSERSKLSPREQQVVRLYARGLSQKEIGAQLDLSAKTVNTYKTNAMKKLHITTNAELIGFALKTNPEE